MGHLISNYSMEHLDEEMVAQVMETVPGLTLAYLDRKGLGKPNYRHWKEIMEGHGLQVIRSRNLEPRDAPTRILAHEQLLPSGRSS